MEVLANCLAAVAIAAQSLTNVDHPYSLVLTPILCVNLAVIYCVILLRRKLTAADKKRSVSRVGAVMNAGFEQCKMQMCTRRQL